MTTVPTVAFWVMVATVIVAAVISVCDVAAALNVPAPAPATVVTGILPAGTA
jgi:hypothetical protein